MAEWEMGDGSTLELVKNRLTIISESPEPGGLSDISTVVLIPAEAVNLASALLQWATQNRSPVQPPPPATPAVLPRKER